MHAAPRRGAREQRSSVAGGACAALGRGGSQRGGARRLGRRGTPGRGCLRSRGGSRASRARARALARGAGRGRSSPGSTSRSCARGQPDSPAKRARPPRAVELARRAIELVGAKDPHRAALLHVLLGEYLHETGSSNALLAAFKHAVELVPAEPPSPERAYALGSLAGGLMVAWRYSESLPIAEQALALARRVGAREAEIRALTVLGGDLAYLGRGEEGVAHFRQALELAEEIGDLIGLERAYVNFTDALTMLGRPRESARVGQAGLEAMRRYGIHSTAARLEPDRGAARDRRLGRGRAPQRRRAARHHRRASPTCSSSSAPTSRSAAASSTPREPTSRPRAPPCARTACSASTTPYLAELALWERRWTDADAAIERRPGAGTQRERRRSASSCAPRDCAHRRSWRRSHAPVATPTPLRDHARSRADAARRRAPRRRRGLGDHTQRRRLARAGRGRVRARPRRRAARAWSDAAATWERLERPPARGLLSLAPGRGARRRRRARAEATRAARAGACRRGPARSKAAAARARAARRTRAARSRRRRTRTPDARQGLEEILGLTPREAEVLTLVARGYTNREIAATLVISVKTAGVHVSHILRKLDAPNRPKPPRSRTGSPERRPTPRPLHCDEPLAADHPREAPVGAPRLRRSVRRR